MSECVGPPLPEGYDKQRWQRWAYKKRLRTDPERHAREKANHRARVRLDRLEILSSPETKEMYLKRARESAKRFRSTVKGKQARKQADLICIKELRPRYLRSLLFGVQATTELLQVKRLQVLIERKVKELS